MKHKYWISVVSAFLFGGGVCAASLYWGMLLPLQSKLEEMHEKADANLARSCEWDVYVAVSLRESNQEKLLKSLDTKMLPAAIITLSQRSDKRPEARYYLWKIKKYSRDFSVRFPEREMNILNDVPDERPSVYGPRKSNADSEEESASGAVRSPEPSR